MGGTRTRVEVLVVSHDRTALALVKRWMREEHHRVVACSSFVSARRFLSKRVPAALITDLQLGPYNGLQLVYLARDKRPTTVVVVVAESEDSVLRTEAARAGALFLVKPVSREDLIRTISAARA